MIRTLLSVANGGSKFFLYPPVGYKMASLVAAIISKQLPATDAKDLTASSSIHTQTHSSNTGEKLGRVAIVGINGVLLRDDQYCGPTGMKTMGQQLRQIDESPDVDAFVFDIHSGGGEVHGTPELAEIISKLKKPAITYVSGMAASAAAWLATSTRNKDGKNIIVLSNEAAEIGSIGTMFSYYDFTSYLQKEGVEEVKIISDNSPQKNKYNFSMPTKEDKQLIKDHLLNPLTTIFQDSVKASRDIAPEVFEEKLSGDMFFAKDAIEYGLADYIGDLDFAIDLALGVTTNNMKLFGKKNKQAAYTETDITALKEEHSNAVIALNEQHAQAIDNIQAKHTKVIAEKDNSIKALTEANSLKDEKIAKQSEEIKSLQDKNEELAKLPVGDDTSLTLAQRIPANGTNAKLAEFYNKKIG